jgi:hypothetical protein
MAKEVKKNVASKKVNAYTKDECIAELSRLEVGNKNKKGENIADVNSRYQMDIRKRLASLS